MSHEFLQIKKNLLDKHKIILDTWHDAALGHVEQQGEPLAREGVVEVVVVVVAVLVQDLGGVLRHPALNSTLYWQSS